MAVFVAGGCAGEAAAGDAEEGSFAAKRGSSLADHLHCALLEHERAVSELRAENDWLLARLAEEPPAAPPPPPPRWAPPPAPPASDGGVYGEEDSLEAPPVVSPRLVYGSRALVPALSTNGDIGPSPRSWASKSNGADFAVDANSQNRWGEDDIPDEDVPQLGIHGARNHAGLKASAWRDRKAKMKKIAEEEPFVAEGFKPEVSEANEDDHADDDSPRRSMSVAHGKFTVVQPNPVEAEESELKKFMQGSFESITSIVIILNTFFLFMQLMQRGKVIGAENGWSELGPWGKDAETMLYIFEHSFNVVFLLELIFRLSVWKAQFFYRKARRKIEFSNMFDLSLVLSGSLDLYVIQPMAVSGAMDLHMFRPLRFFRLLRTLRILQLFRSLLPLRILVKAVTASFVALFWSISLLLIIMVMASLFLCQMLSTALEDEEIDIDTRAWTYQMYGTSPRAVWTVFELTFSGGWPNYVRRLVEEVSPFYAFFFFFYVVAVIFAMFRIVSALFLKDTLAAAAADAEVAIVEKTKQNQAYADKMMTFFRAANASGDGYLTRDEFQAMMEDPEVQTWFSIMEVEVTESKEFFELLSSSDGRVSAHDFVTGIPRLKGLARSQDVVAVRVLSKRMKESLDDIQNFMEKLLDLGDLGDLTGPAAQRV